MSEYTDLLILLIYLLSYAAMYIRDLYFVHVSESCGQLQTYLVVFVAVR